MFFHPTVFLFIGKKKIQILKPTGSAPQVLSEYPWTEQDFCEKLSEAIKAAGKQPKIKLLVSDDFVYTLTVQIAVDEKNVTDAVKKKIQEMIPESLDETIWGFRQISSAKGVLSGAAKVMQAIVFMNPFCTMMQDCFLKAKMPVFAIEPISAALARLFRKEKEPYLLAYSSDTGTELIALDHQTVLGNEVLERPVQKKDVEEFLQFLGKKSGVQYKKIIFVGTLDGMNTQDFAREKFVVETKDIHPLTGLVKKKKWLERKGIHLSIALPVAHKIERIVEKKVLLILFSCIMGFILFGGIAIMVSSSKSVPSVDESLVPLEEGITVPPSQEPAVTSLQKTPVPIKRE